ncbi:glutamyl-tRNA amidotransferase [Piscirickettsia salmonis]|uniref:Aspartyl/glutamyl-tRNA(Asn/Gln) amidotransferase subunit C n=1 Tax=Piscirickettsia salmonis TaxID=1238 RepID=A0A9Q6LJD3_PISSA|nr:Asp-tRNA(Asn)/Glu-tRNA(Gln) amidotransferase subunit GatC [Piscirickettsia salmonis]RNC78542.1 Asp-tRNA(Asn)/Glu-tRNA(Gln) amidotransferase subunit GatC [Piscirickettsiaceae bacterium NZ-RLO2]ALA24059.1 aspartyl/glutamyl-tRNA(Asn/Gln) amidotransferase, C subunit [Piscirickettsia salmonis]APS44463.1 glutamyl-tRNA amidotransferase [Piscirickettsia salmonis]APS47824.1 glutamyl-tRNA amidotransferase [Piscirickettsia salmonis]APS51781.1 glutamyl-tRNA amidotransferase [Piscirickettsia salmonis]
MSISLTDVEKIAHLARLHLNKDDAERYQHDLSNILTLVEQLNTADTQGITPMAHPLDATQRLRSDNATESDQHEKFQAFAPQTEAGLYLVPKVIE